MDFIISGEDRELTGKGYRAITYSSFIIGLQKHIIDLEYAISVPVLDSPLSRTVKGKEVLETMLFQWTLRWIFIGTLHLAICQNYRYGK